MARIPGLRRSFRFPWRSPGDVAADIDDELSFHLERTTQELIEAGWASEAAHTEALRRFGDLEGTRSYCRDLGTRKERQMKLSEAFETFFQDLRFAGRQLWRSPSFTLVAVITLALGTGATTAIFSVVHGVLLRPLPYHEPERLVQMIATYQGEEDSTSNSVPNFVDWRKSNSLAGASVLDTSTFNLTGEGGEPERLEGLEVNANFFSLTGVRPLLGRAFAPDEDKPGATRVAVLSEGLWRRRFGADPAAVGRTVQLNGEPYTLIGVMPRGIEYPNKIEIWAPRVFSPIDLDNRGAYSLWSIARLKPGVSFEQARAETEALGRRLGEQYPQANGGYGMTLVPLTEQMIGDFRTPLLVLLGAVGVVLLIACANVANLLLVRAAGREGEIAVRTAIGAGRGRIARQLITESLVLSLLGGGAGLGLAYWATRLLVTFGPKEMPRLSEVQVDATVLAFTFVTVILTGLLFSLAPALQASRPDLNRALKEGGRGALGRPSSRRARNLLVIAETALAVLLLTAAGLLIRSFAELQQVNLGFRPENLVTFNVSLPNSKYPEEAQIRAFADGLVAKMQAVPGVRSAGLAFGIPLAPGRSQISFEIDGKPPWPQDRDETLLVRLATPGLLRTLGIPLLQGREFSARDRAGSSPVLILNQAAVRRYFPNESPLGQRITLGWVREDQRLGGEIVGVIGDVRQFGADQEILPEVYAPFDQWSFSVFSVVARASSEPETVIAAARGQVRSLDPDLPIYGLQTYADLISSSVAQPRFYMVLLGTFAGIALALAAVGIYGVISYLVQQRTQEIGIRIALGATRGRVLRMVVGQGLTLALIGAGAGVIGALAATRGMASLLYGVSATDPATFAGVSFVLVLVAVAASYLPARRASRIEPQMAIRGEG